MKKAASTYIVLVTIVGIFAGIYSCGTYLLPILSGEISISAHMILIPLLICALCRSFPITVRGEEKLDLSVICVLAMYLTQGAYATSTIYLLSTLFTVEHDSETKRFHHISVIGWNKVLFNDATVLLSIFIPDVLIRLMLQWIPGDISLPMVMLPVILFSLITFVVNGILQLTMFYLNGDLTLFEMAHTLLGLTPNVLAAMPFGLFLGFGFSSESYMWVSFVMLFPLLLARYTWKLYIDSEQARTKLIQAFVNSIEAKDNYTQGHSKRVADYAVQIAEEMHLSRYHKSLIHQGAILHDIGKIGITDRILNKPDRLNDEEFAVMQQHPLIGVQVLKEVGLEPEVLEMVRCHHERYDGTGYPEHRPTKDLSLATRILCVADAYDAMTSDRPYRKGMPPEKALQILRDCKSTQFDPAVIEALISSMERK